MVEEQDMEGDPSAATVSGSQTSSPHTSGPALSRAQRGAIAAQACDTCRSRKQKCDEQRPKCGTCQKFKLECRYRVPQPTKKDKTLVEILERMKTLEDKIDNLSAQGTATPAPHPDFGGPLVHTPSTIVGGSNTSASSSTLLPTPLPDSSRLSENAILYKYASSVRAMLAWPAVQEYLKAIPSSAPEFDPTSTVERDGIPILLETPQSIPLAPPGTAFGRHPSLDIPAMGSAPTVPPVLNSFGWDTMQSLAKAYFDTFNLLHPIVDRHHFVSVTLPTIMINGVGLDDSVQSTLAYLIFALGEVAVETYKDTATGFSKENTNKGHPPGMAFFNEARRRMGFNLTECSLENVQILALAGVYFETCFHHVGYWRMTTSASLACQALILSHPEELASVHGDTIRRAFWHCYIIETSYSPELGMPVTGMEKYEALVRVPDFGGILAEEDYVSNSASHYQEHFASQIVLRRLSSDFHNVLGSSSSSQSSSNSSSTSSAPVMPGAIKPLAMQLDRWRENLLPTHLRWVENDPGGPPTSDPNTHTASGLGVGSQGVSMAAVLPLFSTDLDSRPLFYPYATDIQVALLRTRYYITKHMIHRPFLYKALHHPDQINQEDADGVATCLRSCLMWPIILSPACTRKRLIPCIFFWTQNLLGVLLALHLSKQVPFLARIRASGICGEQFESEASETIRLAIEWIRDLKNADSAAGWAWGVVKRVYCLEE